MSAFASMLDTRTGPVFVKATPADSPTAWVYRHEARVTAAAPLAPPLLWQAEGGGWLLYGYGALAGRHPSFAPDSPDLRPLAYALSIVSGHPWPVEVSKKPLSDRLARFVPPGGEGALDGRTLAHTDAGEFNLLVTGSGVRLIDWALSCPGPEWTDAALWVPRLIAAGHPPEQAHEVARHVPAYRDADPERLGIFARTIHAFWASRTAEDPLPQRVRLTEAAERWARAFHLRG
ncbi:aminoglycoside phosphotransferase [Kitasatospora sp. NBC_01287]|uniref:aminoglycoside phosphotransferase n=1 Tax=Kitasatospora sp. NBC_01287 TaxID=2903573 RepID=UPI002253832E|nr:aminoglycoside phosphotransferase [Kitasatospora sp. NBC_01287]MCX4745407.1 aminoglycoside phosphotransferase [Kitasatospora sp. NBC_01287]